MAVSCFCRGWSRLNKYPLQRRLTAAVLQQRNIEAAQSRNRVLGIILDGRDFG